MQGVAAVPGRAFGPVEELTESESSEKTAEEREVLGRRRRRIRLRRPKPGLTPRERLIDEKVCKNLLSQRCVGQCKKNCLSHFSRSALFSEFMAFRKKWKELHKLDQDRLDFRLHFIMFILCSHVTSFVVLS